MNKAVEIMGSEEAKTPQMYVGYHGHVLTFPIANGTIMNGKALTPFSIFSALMIPSRCFLLAAYLERF